MARERAAESIGSVGVACVGPPTNRWQQKLLFDPFTLGLSAIPFLRTGVVQPILTSSSIIPPFPHERDLDLPSCARRPVDLHVRRAGGRATVTGAGEEALGFAARAKRLFLADPVGLRVIAVRAPILAIEREMIITQGFIPPSTTFP